MKKRNIIIISVSIITLLFGGLVSLAISAFPELIEKEQSEIEQSPKEDVLFDMPSLANNEENKEEVVLTSTQGKNATYVSPYGDPSATISHRSFKGEIAFSSLNESQNSSSSNFELVREIDTFVVSNSHSFDYYKGTSYTSSSQDSSFYIKKEEKQEIIHNSEVNSDAIMNTTIMAIGLCEVLSFILVLKRKRHLRLR